MPALLQNDLDFKIFDICDAWDLCAMFAIVICGLELIVGVLELICRALDLHFDALDLHVEVPDIYFKKMVCILGSGSQILFHVCSCRLPLVRGPRH